MKIAVLGTGEVGQTISKKLLSLGHQVRMGARTKDKASDWAQAAGEGASGGTFEDAAGFAELVVNCVAGQHSLAALQFAGADNLENKVVIDLSNPLDFSGGFPPSLTVCNTDSTAEQLQAAFPKARVVKALNTVGNGVMVDPRMIDEEHTTFICGNDQGAKGEARALLKSFGWREGEIFDLGDLSCARGLEAYLLLWTRIYGASNTWAFNLKLVFAKPR